MMDINERLSVDYDNINEEVSFIIEDILTLCSNGEFAKAIGDNYLNEIKDHRKKVVNRINDNFNLVVIGEFKRGKSTLINAILGTELLPTAVTLETTTINRVSYGENASINAVLKNGRRAKLENDELKKENILKIKEQLPAEINYIDIELDADILKDISIVDTPGMGDLFKEFDDEIAAYLDNADAIIYVTSAKAPLSLGEQTFLSNLLMKDSFTRLFLVVNMADALEEKEQIEKVRTYITDKVKNINQNIYVYTVSALDEFNRKNDKKRIEPEISDYLEDCYMEFEDSLNTDIIHKKSIIKSMRSVKLTQNMLNNIEARINMIKSTLSQVADNLVKSEEEIENQKKQLLDKIDGHKEDLARKIDDMSEESKGWMAVFLSRMKAEIENNASASKTSDLQRYFQFYVMDLIKDAMSECITVHQRQISDEMAVAIDEIAHSTSVGDFKEIDSQVASSLTSIFWTGVDTALFTSDFAAQYIFRVMPSSIINTVGMFYSGARILGSVVGGFIRQKKVSNNQGDFLASFISVYPEFEQNVLSSIDDVYDKLKVNALNKLEEMYISQVDVLSEAILQVNRLAGDKDVELANVVEYFDIVLKNLEQKKEVLKNFE